MGFRWEESSQSVVNDCTTGNIVREKKGANMRYQLFRGMVPSGKRAAGSKAANIYWDSELIETVYRDDNQSANDWADAVNTTAMELAQEQDCSPYILAAGNPLVIELV